MTAEWLPMTSAALMDTIAAKDAIIRDQAERLDVYETALEAERQWRLKSLPALLAAEAKAARCVCHEGRRAGRTRTHRKQPAVTTLAHGETVTYELEPSDGLLPFYEMQLRIDYMASLFGEPPKPFTKFWGDWTRLGLKAAHRKGEREVRRYIARQERKERRLAASKAAIS